MKKDVSIKASRYAKMLWDEWLLKPVDPGYNIGFVYETSGALDLDRLKRALRHYINQNPIIRSYFHEEKGTLYQVLKAEVNHGIAVRDYSGRDQKQIDARLQNAETDDDLDQVAFHQYDKESDEYKTERTDIIDIIL